jgi:hypothetical protein
LISLLILSSPSVFTLAIITDPVLTVSVNCVQEPPRPPSPEPTVTIYNRDLRHRKDLDAADWDRINIRLVGAHPLWGHYLYVGLPSSNFSPICDHYRRLDGTPLDLLRPTWMQIQNCTGMDLSLNSAREVDSQESLQRRMERRRSALPLVGYDPSLLSIAYRWC